MDCLPLVPETPHFRAATDRYATIHDEPVDAVREQFATHADRAGYRGFAAVDDAGRVVGFVYGHRSHVGQLYHDRLREALDGATYRRWLTDCFELVELGVDATRRREGIASTLHERLFERVATVTTVLTTEVDNHPARAFYEQYGWSVVHEPFRVAGTEMAVYGRRL